MIENLPKNKFWELYFKLPQELKEALFDEKNGENLYDICRRYDIVGHFDFLSTGVSDVLLGLLPPNEFLDSITGQVKTDKENIRRIVHEINRFIFFPVKSELEQMYSLQMAPIAGQATGGTDGPATPKKNGKSSYREPVS